MNRAAAVEYLDDLYGSSRSPYLTMAAIPVEDVAGGVKAVIDDALLALDVPYADLATGAPTNVRGYRAALRYMALRLAWGNLNQMSLMDQTDAGAGVGVRSAKWREHIPAQMTEALHEALNLGVDLASSDGSTGWGSLDPLTSPVGFPLGYLEP